MKIKNLTPHPVRVITGKTRLDDGREVDTIVEFLPSGVIPRLETIESSARDLPIESGRGIIPVVTRSWGAVTGLPVARKGTVLIVSSMVLDACPNRTDLIAPDTGSTCVRDNGQIVAVTRFIGRVE